MAQSIRIKMMDEEENVAVSGNIITESSIRHAFLLPPDAVVKLSYGSNGIQTNCRTDAAGTSFLLPDGWSTMQFFARSATPMYRALNERPTSPYYPALPPNPAPTSEAVIKWMFFLPDQMGKSATICVHPRFFVTFRHGTHLRLKVGDALTMYTAEKEANEQVGIDVCVVNVNEELDFVLLKSKSDVVERGPSIARAQESEPFTLAGFGNEQGSLSCLPGEIHSCREYYFRGDVQQLGPFILGTSRSSRGDSGGGIWGSRGLIGMNHGCTTMPPQLHHLAISEAATFSAKNIIIPACWFKYAYMEELEKERKKEKVASPPQKKPCLQTEVEGLGTFYGSSD
uniref:Uncharacterized protein n=2 Tax=Bursaphelenchus xylophilus TaxID=6326 RepID=A0A1I7SHC3_BURXY